MSGTIIPNSGRRSSEEGGPNLENGACRPRAVTAAAPSVRSGSANAYLVCEFIAFVEETQHDRSSGGFQHGAFGNDSIGCITP